MSRGLLVTCSTACEHHQKLIRNLVSVLANKILILNDKITHVGKRTTRDKLLSYLSAESISQSSLSFDIPFDRQQLADYLCIDRAAMSTEISKLQKDGFIKTRNLLPDKKWRLLIMSKDEYLITDVPLKALTVFAMPMILGSFFQQIYNMADSIIVGQFVGSSALAAVGACAALTNVFICVALGAGVGAGVLVSRYFGARKYGKMKTIVSTSLLSF